MNLSINPRLLKASAVLNAIEWDIAFMRFPDRTHRVSGLLAGGCARDIAFGVELKDWDIVFGRDVTLDQIRFSLEENGISDYDVFPFYKKNVVDRIKFCVKFSFEGENYDVLVYETESALEAVQEFDFNLNQFFISRATGKATYAGESDLKSGLKSVRGDHSPERGLYMSLKWYGLHEEGKL